jgi:hypothetical protein
MKYQFNSIPHDLQHSRRMSKPFNHGDDLNLQIVEGGMHLVEKTTCGIKKINKTLKTIKRKSSETFMYLFDVFLLTVT